MRRYSAAAWLFCTYVRVPVTSRGWSNRCPPERRTPRKSSCESRCSRAPISSASRAASIAHLPPSHRKRETQRRTIWALCANRRSFSTDEYERRAPRPRYALRRDPPNDGDVCASRPCRAHVVAERKTGLFVHDNRHFLRVVKRFEGWFAFELHAERHEIRLTMRVRYRNVCRRVKLCAGLHPSNPRRAVSLHGLHPHIVEGESGRSIRSARRGRFSCEYAHESGRYQRCVPVRHVAGHFDLSADADRRVVTRILRDDPRSIRACDRDRILCPDDGMVGARAVKRNREAVRKEARN